MLRPLMANRRFEINLMGGQHQPAMIDPSQWVEVRRSADQLLVMNKRTQLIAEKHSSMDRLDQPERVVESMLQLRKSWPRHVAGVFGWEVEGQEVLCGQAKRIVVYSQHLEQRLSSLGELHQTRGLQILLDSMQGFMTIYHATGVASKVEPGMICFDKDEEVKVWVHPRLCQLRPLETKTRLESEVEHEIIDDLFSIIKQQLVGAKFSDKLLNYLIDNLVQPFTEKNIRKTITNWLRSPLSCDDEATKSPSPSAELEYAAQGKPAKSPRVLPPPQAGPNKIWPSSMPSDNQIPEVPAVQMFNHTNSYSHSIPVHMSAHPPETHFMQMRPAQFTVHNHVHSTTHPPHHLTTMYQEPPRPPTHVTDMYMQAPPTFKQQPPRPTHVTDMYMQAPPTFMQQSPRPTHVTEMYMPTFKQQPPRPTHVTEKHMLTPPTFMQEPPRPSTHMSEVQSLNKQIAFALDQPRHNSHFTEIHMQAPTFGQEPPRSTADLTVLHMQSPPSSFMPVPDFTLRERTNNRQAPKEQEQGGKPSSISAVTFKQPSHEPRERENAGPTVHFQNVERRQSVFVGGQGEQPGEDGAMYQVQHRFKVPEQFRAHFEKYMQEKGIRI